MTNKKRESAHASASQKSERLIFWDQKRIQPAIYKWAHILNQVYKEGLLFKPPPMKSALERGNSQYFCKYYKDIGNIIKSCF